MATKRLPFLRRHKRNMFVPKYLFHSYNNTLQRHLAAVLAVCPLQSAHATESSTLKHHHQLWSQVAACNGALQRHPAAAPCSGTSTRSKAHPPLSQRHPQAAPCAGTRQQHFAAGPGRPLQTAHATLTAAPASSTLKQHPSSAPCSGSSHRA